MFTTEYFVQTTQKFTNFIFKHKHTDTCTLFDGVNIQMYSTNIGKQTSFNYRKNSSMMPKNQNRVLEASAYATIILTFLIIINNNKTPTSTSIISGSLPTLKATYTLLNYSVSQKIPPWGFVAIFPKRLGILWLNFTCLLHVPIYARLQIFIQLSATLTKLRHIKRDHLVHIMCTKERCSTRYSYSYSSTTRVQIWSTRTRTRTRVEVLVLVLVVEVLVYYAISEQDT